MEVARSVGVAALVGFGLTRMVQTLTRTILLPSSLIGRNLPQLAQFIAESNVLVTRVSIPVSNSKLDAAIIGGNTGREWIIYSNANGVCYEHILPYLYRISSTLNKRVLVYNYRGVGNSSGTCFSAQDMVQDLKACVEYLQQQHYSDILLWGHSIGGAVSVLVGNELRVKVVADRSFANLSLVVLGKLTEGPLGSILCGFFSSVLVLCATVMVDFGFKLEYELPVRGDGMLRLVAAGICLGFFAMRLNLPQVQVRNMFAGGVLLQLLLGDLLLAYWQYEHMPTLLLLVFVCTFECANWNPLRFAGMLQRLVDMQGWVMNPGAVVENGGKLVCTFINGDEMIPLQLSLKSSKTVELDGPRNMNEARHMYALSESELRRIERAVASL